MKKILLLILLTHLISCGDHLGAKQEIYDLSGVELEKSAVLLAKDSECCSFTGDGFGWLIYELTSVIEYKSCHYLGAYSSAPYRVSAFEKYLANGEVCIFDKYIDNGHNQVAIQGNRIMFSWASW